MAIKMKKITPEEREYFFYGLQLARRYGLVWEYITFYKRDRRRGASIHGAVWYACCEWDLG